jgi:hypothetical protein
LPLPVNPDAEPDPAYLHDYRADALPTVTQFAQPGAATRRVRAIRALHTLWRRWQADVANISPSLSLKEHVEAIKALREAYAAKGAPANYDLELRAFVRQISEVIWASPDPLAYMTALWTVIPKKLGAPRRTENRNLYLAVDIQELVDEGKTVDQACLDVFGRLDGTDAELDPGTLRNIYFREIKGEGKIDVQGLAELKTWLTRGPPE